MVKMFKNKFWHLKNSNLFHPFIQVAKHALNIDANLKLSRIFQVFGDLSDNLLCVVPFVADKNPGQPLLLAFGSHFASVLGNKWTKLFEPT